MPNASLLSVREAAERLGVGPVAVRQHSDPETQRDDLLRLLALIEDPPRWRAIYASPNASGCASPNSA